MRKSFFKSTRAQLLISLIAAVSAAPVLADAGADVSTAPMAYIISPQDGAEVASPLTIKFGLSNFSVSPAGTPHPHGGHHHLLIDTPLPNLAMPIPLDAHHHHFGKGQTETVIELAPGKHTLQLLVGDHLHRPHAEPVYSKQITITVK